ncbi:uncharacterized protein MONOS_7776 [Monocercomonoides exilis]|uniref:uncharacterized protein n=1 Tax=Monocercomonoides exilis TaxID=2049356 RepID=UPI00355978C0|nr:hypothetical protein MONOS_7776 [Monocercomonoides exilis]|eukprot:MONOS_7776.1-p1 / transcript=MONOS_7776.1 / gene=MONOS_7776 / organism=Monocercomonoides_exilis_PA203 / gene_product=unspecified product / transcript_product=unspecified product / location=Mono_scaffold00274:64358-64970(-) / protein_length=143 / sequence_SO=supercontig / SO=protein_coding / is_pseudo=false
MSEGQNQPSAILSLLSGSEQKPSLLQSFAGKQTLLSDVHQTKSFSRDEVEEEEMPRETLKKSNEPPVPSASDCGYLFSEDELMINEDLNCSFQRTKDLKEIQREWAHSVPDDLTYLYRAMEKNARDELEQSQKRQSKKPHFT